MNSWKKVPKHILIIDNLQEIPCDLKKNISSLVPTSLVDYEEKDRVYDLVFLADYVFRFNLKYYKTISTAEIIFKRWPTSLSSILEGLNHYSECEIRNGL